MLWYHHMWTKINAMFVCMVILSINGFSADLSQIQFMRDLINGVTCIPTRCTTCAIMPPRCADEGLMNIITLVNVMWLLCDRHPVSPEQRTKYRLKAAALIVGYLLQAKRIIRKVTNFQTCLKYRLTVSWHHCWNRKQQHMYPLAGFLQVALWKKLCYTENDF